MSVSARATEPGDSVTLLEADSELARRVPGYQLRPSQLAMAKAVEEALESRSRFIAESGTGTGKTFAYLVPALRSGLKVIVSTGTRNLQDQLFRRDLPLVRDALALPRSVALLKGRSNYLCLDRLRRTAEEGRFTDRALADDLMHIQSWSGRTKTGDVAEVNDVPEDSDIWPMVTSTVENCLGSQCPDYATCHVNRARREALDADVLVVNHHLFFADLMLREEGFGQLLPGVDGVIFDEAHQLPEIAQAFFGVSVSSTQLRALCRDAVAEEMREKSGVEGLRDAAAALEKATADLRLALGSEARRDDLARVRQTTSFDVAHADLQAALDRFASILARAAAAGQGLAACANRAADLRDRLSLIHLEQSHEYVVWIEASGRGFVLRLTPLDIAATFQQHAGDAERAWIFTSATLAVGNDFSHFQRQLGLEAAQCARWPSPFDYEAQSLAYLPANLPEPSSRDHTLAVVEAALPVLAASGGRAFLLFTSHRALRIAADALAGRLPYPLLVQGSMPRNALLDAFRASGNGVLLGTSSFWEGVDVRGEALSCVIIDKLPFAPPDDPVLRARAIAREEEGGNAFVELQLPAAVIALKQGVGRLIRDIDDRGVLMLGDRRLLTKSYGRIFRKSLPPMPWTQDLADVERFFADVGVSA